MGKQVSVIEPLKLPDQRRMGVIPSLPAWAASRIALLKENWQKNPTSGRGESVLTLPPEMVLGTTEKQAIAAHIAALEPMFEMTPIKSAEHEAAMLVLVTKLVKVMPAQKSDAVGYEARGEAYLLALEDVPFWAVEEAIRRWYRKECGEKYDYEWAPPPPTLREVSLVPVYELRSHIRKLNNLSLAKPYTEFSEEHRTLMRLKFLELLQQIS